MPKRYDSDLQISFHHDAAPGDSVPADILATTLQSLQSVVRLLGASHGGAGSSGAGSTTAASDARYAITCHLPVPGSYAVPVTIAGPQNTAMADGGLDVLGDLRALLRATQDQRDEDLGKLFPAPAARAAAARAVLKMVPGPRSGTRLMIEYSSGERIFAPDPGTRRFLKSLAVRPAGEAERSVVGHLNKIDFQKQRIRLRHPPSRRDLSCSYPPRAEPMLVDCRRDLIQVVGEITLDLDEVPKGIRRVDSINRVDVSPIRLSGFKSGTKRVRAKHPMVFQPIIHNAYKHFALRDPPFGIHLLSVTREELEANLLEELDSIWRHFARADDADLMPDARELKQQLHNAFNTA